MAAAVDGYVAKHGKRPGDVQTLLDEGLLREAPIYYGITPGGIVFSSCP